MQADLTIKQTSFNILLNFKLSITFNIGAVLTVNTQKSGRVANNPIIAIKDVLMTLQDVEVFIIRQQNTLIVTLVSIQ